MCKWQAVYNAMYQVFMEKKGGIIANGKLSAMNTLTMHYHAAAHTSAGLLSVQ